MQLRDKTIYIISRENWGGMLMSKQHYAIELATRGNTVYFINHPDLRKKLNRGSIKIERTDFENIYSVSHRFIHPNYFKDKWRGIYNLFTALHIRRLVKKIGRKPDIVWTFDVGNALPLKFFPDCEVKIFMPVDGPFGIEDEIISASQSDLIISITNEILETYKNLNIPKLKINHGVGSVFINTELSTTTNSPIRVGYSGSLVRNDLDIETFITIISNHPDMLFEFWGEYDYLKSSIHLPQDVGTGAKDFIEKLKSFPNVKLHGTVNPDVLAEGIKKMDLLLICYKLYDKDQNLRNDQNSHKVLEYLGTGKTVIASFLSVYNEEYPDLLVMTSSKENNREIPGLFDKVIKNLDYYNSAEKQVQRIDFAKQFTYSRQVENIEAFINTLPRFIA